MVEVLLGDHAAKQVSCRIYLGVFGNLRPAGEHRRRAPRPFPAVAAACLLDQPVLGELAQVERAAGRALAEQFTCLGCGELAVDAELAQERSLIGWASARKALGSVSCLTVRLGSTLTMKPR